MSNLHPLLTLRHALTSASVDVRRNLRLTILTTLLVLVAFLIVDAIAFLSAVTTTSLAALEERLAIVAYFKPDVSDDDARAVRDEMERAWGVRAVEHVTAAEAQRRFSERHADNAVLTDALRLFPDNPFGARLMITLTDPSAFDAVKTHIQQSAFASQLRDTDFPNIAVTIERVTAVADKVRRVAFGVVVFFSALALVAAYSVVGMRVAAEREAVHVMRIVGATRPMVELPFLLMAIIYVGVALAMNLAVVASVGAAFGDQARLFFAGMPGDPLAFFVRGAPSLYLWKAAIAIILMTASARLALGKYAQE